MPSGSADPACGLSPTGGRSTHELPQGRGEDLVLLVRPAGYTYRARRTEAGEGTDDHPFVQQAPRQLLAVAGLRVDEVRLRRRRLESHLRQRLEQELASPPGVLDPKRERVALVKRGEGGLLRGLVHVEDRPYAVER